MKNKNKTKSGIIQFSPPLKKSSVLDEVFAEDAQVHIERMSDESIFMSITTKQESFGFDFVVGEKDIVNAQGETVRPLNLRAWKS